MNCESFVTTTDWKAFPNKAYTGQTDVLRSTIKTLWEKDHKNQNKQTKPTTPKTTTTKNRQKKPLQRQHIPSSSEQHIQRQPHLRPSYQETQLKKHSNVIHLVPLK